MVASGLLITAITGLVHLLAFAAQANVRSRHSLYAATRAAQKIEVLRAASSADAAGGEGIEYLDDRGAELLGPGPKNAAYIRRWNAAASSADPAGPLVIRVVVVSRAPLAESVELVTLRMRSGSPTPTDPCE